MNVRTESWLLKLYTRWLSMSKKYCLWKQLISAQFPNIRKLSLNTSNPWLLQKKLLNYGEIMSYQKWRTFSASTRPETCQTTLRRYKHQILKGQDWLQSCFLEGSRKPTDTSFRYLIYSSLTDHRDLINIKRLIYPVNQEFERQVNWTLGA